MIVNKYEMSLWSHRNIPQLDSDDGYTSVTVLKTTEVYIF